MKIQKLNEWTNESIQIKFEHRVQIYYKTFSFFLETPPSMEMIIKYLNDEPSTMQEHIGNYLKDEIFWATGVGIMDAVDTMIEQGFENGNFKGYSQTEFDNEFGVEYNDWVKIQKTKDFNL